MGYFGTLRRHGRHGLFRYAAAAWPTWFFFGTLRRHIRHGMFRIRSGTAQPFHLSGQFTRFLAAFDNSAQHPLPPTFGHSSRTSCLPTACVIRPTFHFLQLAGLPPALSLSAGFQASRPACSPSAVCPPPMQCHRKRIVPAARRRSFLIKCGRVRAHILPALGR